jgi:hypothetical protein
VDFERRIAEIYQTCRHPDAINTAFQQLQLDLAGEINDAMINARKSLLENFDEDVQERLRLRDQNARASLGRLERLLMRFTQAALNGHAKFDEDSTGFQLNTLPAFLTSPASGGEGAAVPLGRYELPRRSEEAHIYRLAHPLAQSLIEQAQHQSLQPSKLVFDYDAYGAKVSVVEQLRGKSGTLLVQKLKVQALGTTEEHLLMAAVDRSEKIYDQSIAEKLLNIPAHSIALPRLHSLPEQTALPDVAPVAGQNMLDFAAANVWVPSFLEEEVARQKARILSDLETRNLSFFAQETEKLDSWADDLKVGLEREIKELDRQIKEARSKSKGAATLAEKLAMQKEQRDLEGHRDRKRRELFQRQDEIQGRRDNLIDELEQQLSQQVTVLPLLACEWEVA